MAQKKDFAGINTGSRVQISIEQATSKRGQQTTASPQEVSERREQLQTQGRKGAKAIRINMAFSESNHQFIKVMARISGQTMTEFTNFVIEQYRTEHPEIYEQAKAIINQF